MLELSHLPVLARGQHRLIYEDPDDPSRLIKVMSPELVEQRWRGVLPWHQQRQRLRQYKGYLRELREYLALHARGLSGPSPLARTFGLVETDLGLGLVVEKLVGPDGALAPTALKLVEREGRAPWIERGLEQWLAGLLAHDVIVGDMNPRNVVYGSASGADPRFIMIDGYGEKNFIPRNSMSRVLNRRHNEKLYRRMMDRIEAVARSRE